MRSKNKFLACLLSTTTLFSSCPGFTTDSYAAGKTSNGLRSIVEKAKMYKTELLIGGGVLGSAIVIAAAIAIGVTKSKKDKSEAPKKESDGSKQSNSVSQPTVQDPTPNTNSGTIKIAKIINLKVGHQIAGAKRSYRYFLVSDGTKVLLPFPENKTAPQDEQLIQFVTSNKEELKKALAKFSSNKAVCCENGLFKAEENVGQEIEINEEADIAPLGEYVDMLLASNVKTEDKKKEDSEEVEEQDGDKEKGEEGQKDIEERKEDKEKGKKRFISPVNGSILAQIRDGKDLSHVDAPLKPSDGSRGVFTKEKEAQRQFDFVTSNLTTLAKDEKVDPDDGWDDDVATSPEPILAVTFKWFRAKDLEVNALKKYQDDLDKFTKAEDKQKVPVNSPYCSFKVGDTVYIVPQSELLSVEGFDYKKSKEANTPEALFDGKLPITEFKSDKLEKNTDLVKDLANFSGSGCERTDFGDYKAHVISKMLDPMRKKLEDMGIDKSARFLVLDEIKGPCSIDSYQKLFKVVTADKIDEILKNPGEKKLYKLSDDQHIFVFISAEHLKSYMLLSHNLKEESQAIWKSVTIPHKKFKKDTPSPVTPASTEDFVDRLLLSGSGVPKLFSKVYDPATDEETCRAYKDRYEGLRKEHAEWLIEGLNQQLPSIFTGVESEDDAWDNFGLICLTDHIDLPNGEKFECKYKILRRDVLESDSTLPYVYNFITEALNNGTLFLMGTAHNSLETAFSELLPPALQTLPFNFYIIVDSDDSTDGGEVTYSFEKEVLEDSGKKSIELILKVGGAIPSYVEVYEKVWADWCVDKEFFIKGAKEAINAGGPKRLHRAMVPKDQAQAIKLGRKYRPGDGSANP